MHSEIEKWREEIDQKLPSKYAVLERNVAINLEYAKMYQSDAEIYKWAGITAFASFHMWEQLYIQDWKSTGILSLKELCKKRLITNYSKHGKIPKEVIMDKMEKLIKIAN